MIHIESEREGDKISSQCRISGRGYIINCELEFLFKNLLEDDDLRKVLLITLEKVQDDFTNKGDSK